MFVVDECEDDECAVGSCAGEDDIRDEDECTMSDIDFIDDGPLQHNDSSSDSSIERERENKNNKKKKKRRLRRRSSSSDSDDAQLPPPRCGAPDCHDARCQGSTLCSAHRERLLRNCMRAHALRAKANM